MIARRLSLPRIRSPDCGYSSTKSSESNRSCASMSLAIIACMNCSTVARLSPAIASSPGRCHVGSRLLRRAYASRKARLRANILVQPENVVRVVRAFERPESFVFRITVDRADDVVTLLHHVVDVVTGPRKRLDGGHRRA